MSDDDFDDARLVRKLLDPVNHEIVKILEKNQHYFYIGELQSKLAEIGIELERSTLIVRLTEFQEFGWINKPMHAYRERTKWEPYSSKFYQNWLAKRKSIETILKSLREDADIAKILPEAEKLEMNYVPIKDDQKKVNAWKNRMRQTVAKLLEHFDKLDGNSKKYTFHLAYKSDYFDNLPYG